MPTDSDYVIQSVRGVKSDVKPLNAEFNAAWHSHRMDHVFYEELRMLESRVQTKTEKTFPGIKLIKPGPERAAWTKVSSGCIHEAPPNDVGPKLTNDLSPNPTEKPFDLPPYIQTTLSRRNETAVLQQRRPRLEWTHVEGLGVAMKIDPSSHGGGPLSGRVQPTTCVMDSLSMPDIGIVPFRTNVHHQICGGHISTLTLFRIIPRSGPHPNFFLALRSLFTPRNAPRSNRRSNKLNLPNKLVFGFRRGRGTSSVRAHTASLVRSSRRITISSKPPCNSASVHINARCLKCFDLAY
ncbi:hypothetical protein B0H16DRAFT_1448312 [Mycena metata]|uniref:Uncharacterized protein n=1 Tax=Mycena metata TaxID=1033252 RepID=A0AAD7KBU7_9AGAR|nr:hypothetical protein B0H16DRAFT_1448312 [Mycena metata]